MTEVNVVVTIIMYDMVPDIIILFLYDFYLHHIILPEDAVNAAHNNLLIEKIDE